MPILFFLAVFAASIAAGIGFGRSRAANANTGGGGPRREPRTPPPLQISPISSGRGRATTTEPAVTTTPATPATPPAFSDPTEQEKWLKEMLAAAKPSSVATGGNHVPTLESWMPYFLLYGPDVPSAVQRAWTKEETGGNPCGIGNLPPAGATQPQEYGLAQLNVEDASNVKIATPAALRQMCGTGPTWKPGMTKAEKTEAIHAWQAVTRPLTEAETIEHAVAAIALMRHCAQMATKYLGGDRIVNQGGGGTWNGPDFWRLAKCYHGSSAVCNVFPIVENKLGRLPTWLEFKDMANDISLAHTEIRDGKPYHPYGQAFLDSVWKNAETVGDALLDPAAKI